MRVESVAAAARATQSGDDALIRRAAAGDAEAFDALVATRIDRCYRLAYAILSDPSDAADATQDALVHAWRQLPQLRDQRAFDGWLHRIVANAARMSRRSRSRRVEVRAGAVLRLYDADGDLPLRDLADPRAMERLDDVLDADRIGRAFDRLADRDRVLLVLHHVEERSVAEIAAWLRIPLGTAKWRLHQARSALERAMESDR